MFAQPIVCKFLLTTNGKYGKCFYYVPVDEMVRINSCEACYLAGVNEFMLPIGKDRGEREGDGEAKKGDGSTKYSAHIAVGIK